MKHPKRFCVKCSREELLEIRGAMYHCKKCGQEVCRMGDGDRTRQTRSIRGGLDTNSAPDGSVLGLAPDSFACQYPEILSDEHRLWEPRNDEEEFLKQQRMNRFRAAFEGLTDRQKEIVRMVAKTGNQESAASKLGVSHQAVSKAIISIKKKIDGCVFKKEGKE